jgi:hypothetical protein
MRASAMPRIRLARRRQTPALSARNEVHWPRPRNFQARNGDQGAFGRFGRGLLKKPPQSGIFQFKFEIAFAHSSKPAST